MPRYNVYHIVHRDGEWAVRLEGSSQPSATAATRAEAVDAAGSLLRALGTGRVVVHDEDGRIEAGYRFDAIPTRDASRGRDRLLLALGGAALVGLVAGVTVGIRRLTS